MQSGAVRRRAVKTEGEERRRGGLPVLWESRQKSLHKNHTQECQKTALRALYQPGPGSACGGGGGPSATELTGREGP